MIPHNEIAVENLHRKIRRREILFGGNKKLKVYGRLNCASGKRMKRGNRVFFATEAEALQNGYRPCAHCMKAAYSVWKHNIQTCKPLSFLVLVILFL
ncbi:MAG: Ada metal-binding domain-containing protein [Agriterribacter sp.]